MSSSKLILVMAVQLLVLPTFIASEPQTIQPEPEFGSTMDNITVAKGRDASFTCVVLNLGSHRVAWIKADDKGILAMHDRVLTNNARLSILHSDLHTWTLQIRDVRRSDRGVYMCQINTDPMKSQTAALEVVIPPDISNEEGGGELLIPEGGSAKLSCKARGVPHPRVTWRREDGQEFVIRNSNGVQKTKVYEGEVLSFHKITRSEMGAYLCIASNGVPPSVSRRIMVNVNFYPIIQVHNQLVGAPLGSNITLDCVVEASPKPINYWARDTGEFIISNDKYRMEEMDINQYTTRLRLHLRLSSPSDEGTYKCASKNSMGDSEGIVRVYAIKKPVNEQPHAAGKGSDYSEEVDSSNRMGHDYDEDEDGNGSDRQKSKSNPSLDKSLRATANTQLQSVTSAPTWGQGGALSAQSKVPSKGNGADPLIRTRSYCHPVAISLILALLSII